MPLARIITTSQEAVLGLVHLLENRGYEVETVAPGTCDLGPVDLELQVECCPVEEAMRQVGARSDAEEVAVFLTANALSMTGRTLARKLPVGAVSSVQALPATGTEGACVAIAPRPLLLSSPPPAPAEPASQSGAAILQFPAPAPEIAFEHSLEGDSGEKTNDAPQLHPESGVHEVREPEGALCFPVREAVRSGVESKQVQHLLLRSLVTARSFVMHAGPFLAQTVTKLGACKRAIRDFRFRRQNREAVRIAGRIAVFIAVVWTFSLAVGWVRTRSLRQGWQEQLGATSPTFVRPRESAPPIRVSMETRLASSPAPSRGEPQAQTRKIIRKRDRQGRLIEEEVFSSDVTIRHFRSAQPAGPPHRPGRQALAPENPALTAKSEADRMPVVRRYSDLQ